MLQTSTIVLSICLLFTVYQVVFENFQENAIQVFTVVLLLQPEGHCVPDFFFFFFSFETKWKALGEQMILEPHCSLHK